MNRVPALFFQPNGLLHAQTLWQCDFFPKRAWTLCGRRYLFVMVFQKVATRRVFFTRSAEHPNAEWVAQPTRQFVQYARDHKIAIDLVFPRIDIRRRALVGGAWSNGKAKTCW